MLPNVTEAFEVEYITADNYTDFFDQVYEYRNNGTVFPYRYGSYQLFKADKKNHFYQMIAYLNTTSQDVTAMYPHFMYNAILRVATENPDFIYDITTAPYPIY